MSADHLLFCDDAEARALAAAGTVAVLLPGTSFLLRTGRAAPAQVLRDAGVTMALGTDCNPGTCYCESMQLMVALACVHGGLTPEEAVLAATDGAARAVGRGPGRAGSPPGRLRPGRAGRAELPRPGLPPRGQPGRAGRQGRQGGGRAVTGVLVECVPNVSEGRRHEVVDELVAAFAGADPGVLVLDRSSDPDHNRTVITLAGPGPALVDAAVAGARACVRLIDLNRHRGVHPRMGALDVLPFVPFGEATRLAGAGDPDLDCAALAERAGRRIAADVGVPVYLYGAAARRPERAALPAVRGRGFEALRDALGPPGATGSPGDHPGGPPDPPIHRGTTPAVRTPRPGARPRRAGLHPTAGATAVGAREILVAYNVDLAGADLDLARRIAAAVRERDGGLPRSGPCGVDRLSDRGSGDRRGGPRVGAWSRCR